MTTTKEREFRFTRKDFQTIQELVAERTGIALSDIKSDMIYSRLVRRLRATGCEDFQGYLALLEDRDSPELENFVNAVTTNLTAFFRENHHFEHMAHTALPELMAARAGERRLRLWSAGCSTGEEAYSMAMVVDEVVPAAWDVEILATDLDTEVVRRGAAGIYAEERVKNLSRERLKAHFLRGKGRNAGKVRVKPHLRERVRFEQLNMIETPWPLREHFDIVFCRNVIIYFNKETQKALFAEIPKVMQPDGWLYIGHSETLWQVSDEFEALGHTIYRRHG